MSDRPLISVVMSVYNSQKYLADSIESILKQTYENFEFIIVDDGSSDQSLSIIQSYMKKDSRIVLISRENKGLPYSLNEAISVSKGQYIARMDADDISLPERFQKQIMVLQGDRAIGVCGSSAFYFKDDDQNNSRLFVPKKKHDELKISLLYSSCFVHPTVMIRKSELIKLDYIYNESFFNSQDYELWGRLVDNTEFFNIQEPLLYYRVNEDGISSTTNSDSLSLRFPLLKNIYKPLLEELGISPSEDFLKLHFQLGLNSELRNTKLDSVAVLDYIDEVLNANSAFKKYNQSYLRSFLYGRYIIFLIYSWKKGREIKISHFLKTCFFKGVFSILHQRVRNFKALLFSFFQRLLAKLKVVI
ncbi:glycosyltransferase family 2 protein [Marinomonas sp. FW-1]|uniref:glycosyltransferase family 2 protein n=1 Tax=Marinomonas sp. FW-1 TaxID=2071621 RepID=UPI0010BF6FEC|nr:glycosyltransferase family 2 protein [Marinomonas sp. FW-1]